MESEPTLSEFVSFLVEEMNQHPELIVPADEEQLKRIERLVTGVG